MSDRTRNISHTEEGTSKGNAYKAGTVDKLAERQRSTTGLLENPNALLTRSHLGGLGLNRRAVDAVFRACPVVVFPGYSRPLVRVSDYLALVERSTYDDARVR